MAMTQTQLLDAYRFFNVAFNAAPGTTYMDQLDTAYAGGMTTQQIVNEYTTKPEFTSIYPNFLPHEQFATRLVNNVVGSSATDAAKEQAVNDIVGALGAGWTRGDVIFRVFNNLANKPEDDAEWGGTAKQLENRVKVAEYYTETLGGSSTDLATLQQVVANVTDTTDVSSSEKIEEAMGGATSTGQTFTLTKGVDDLKATTGNDTIIAAIDANDESRTLNTGDVIDGGAGKDTLDLTIGANQNPTVTIKNVEVLEVRNAAAGGNVDMRNTDGAVKTIVEKQSTNGFTADFIAAADVAVSIKDVTTANLVSDYNWNAGALAGAADAASLTLNNVVGTVAGRHTVQLQGGTATQGFETVNVKTEGAASNLANLVVTGSGATNTMTKLVVTGDQNLTIANTAFAATGGAIDASAFTGNLVVNAVNAVDVDFKGGKGNDTILFGATLLATDKIDGGDGTDTLGANAFADLQAAFTAGRVSNIEAIRIEQAIATNNGTLDVSKAGNVNSVSINGIGANTNTLTNLADNSTVTLTANGTGTLVANIKDASLAGTANTLNINLGVATDAAVVTAGTITAAGVETINVATAGTIASGAGTNTLTLTANADLAKLVVTGNEDVTVTFTGGGAALKEFDASKATGVQNTSNLAFSASGAALTGGNKADVLAGGAGNDTIVGGAGNDQITGGAGSDVLTGGEGSDTFVMSDNGNAVNLTNPIVDTIKDFTLGSGGDVLNIAALGNRPVVDGAGSLVKVTALNGALPATGTADGRAELIVLDSSVADLQAANASALNAKLFNLSSTGYGNVLVAYADSASGNVRLATATIAGGDITSVTDFAVLEGVTTAALASGFHVNNLAGLGTAGVNANVLAGQTATGTAGNDTFTAANAAAFNGATITGIGGTDSLVVAGVTGGAVAVGNGTTGGTITAGTTIGSIDLQGGTSVGAFTLAANAALTNTVVTNSSTAAGATVNLGNNAGARFVGTGNGQNDSVTFANAGQTAALGNGDTVAGAVAGNVVTSTTAANETINVGAVGALAATFTDAGGAGDILLLANTTGTVVTGAITGFETLNLGTATGGNLTVTLGAGSSGITTLIVDGHTNTVNNTVNLSAAQLDALTTITASGGANGTQSLVTTDTGAVTVNLSDSAYTAANWDAINFSASGANRVQITLGQNQAAAALTYTAGTAGNDTITVSGDLGQGGNATLATSAFENVNFTVAQTNVVTLSNDVAQAVTATGGGAFILGATTGGSFAGSGSATYNVTGNTGADTITITSSGQTTIAGGNGIDTINLNATNGVQDQIVFADGAGGAGIIAAANRDTITGFNVANDRIILDIDATTVATVAGAPAVQAAAIGGAVAISNANDIVILSGDMGGATDVLTGGVDGTNLLANLGGALTITATTNQAYLVAYDNGKAFLYHVWENLGAGGGDTAIAATDIKLIGTFEGITLNSLTAANFVLAA